MRISLAAIMSKVFRSRLTSVHLSQDCDSDRLVLPRREIWMRNSRISLMETRARKQIDPEASNIPSERSSRLPLVQTCPPNATLQRY